LPDPESWAVRVDQSKQLQRALLAYREVVRAIAAEGLNPTESYNIGALSPDGIKQFNSLAKKVNEHLGEPALAILDEDTNPGNVNHPRAVEVLGQVNIALDLLGVETGTDPDVGYDRPHDAGKPRVFIGCSVEGLRYAKIIQMQLSAGVHARIWNQGVFGLMRGTLETLVAERNNYDYAILVLTPDDTRMKRSQKGPIPRDNVVFELGLFMGALGRERVFMVVQNGTELPTDLAGITPARFDIGEDIDLESALGPVTTMLEIAMNLI
jgi:hypothetical protein